MKYITKYFETSRRAEGYLEKLYGAYSHVRLIKWPNTESGNYTFEVQY